MLLTNKKKHVTNSEIAYNGLIDKLNEKQQQLRLV